MKVLNKKRVMVIVVILLLAAIIGGIIFWRAVSDKPQSVVSREPAEDRLSDVTYDTASTYKDSGSYAKGTITVAGVALDGTSFETLEVADSVGEGEVYLDNLKISDELFICGGGENSVYMDIASDGTKKAVNEKNPGCSVSRVRVEKQNTHVVIGSPQIDELIVHGTNHIEIYGHVNKITVVASDQKDHEYTSGIFVMEGASVGQIELKEQTGIYGAQGSIGQVTASAEGIDTTVQPLPANDPLNDQNRETEDEEDDEDEDDRGNRRNQNTSRPSSDGSTSLPKPPSEPQTNPGVTNPGTGADSDPGIEQTPEPEPEPDPTPEPDPVPDPEAPSEGGNDVEEPGESDPDPGSGGWDDEPGTGI